MCLTQLHQVYSGQLPRKCSLISFDYSNCATAVQRDRSRWLYVSETYCHWIDQRGTHQAWPLSPSTQMDSMVKSTPSVLRTRPLLLCAVDLLMSSKIRHTCFLKPQLISQSTLSNMSLLSVYTNRKHPLLAAVGLSLGQTACKC